MNSVPSELLGLLKNAERLLADKSYPAAHALCLKILERDPANAEAYFLLGVLAADHRNHRKAVELFERAAVLGPDAAKFHAHRAKSLVAMSRFVEARSAAERAAAFDPQDALTLDTIGVAFSRIGRHSQAVLLFKRAVEADPHNAGYSYNLAASLQFSGAFIEAERFYRRTIALDPQSYRSYSALVQLRRQTPEGNFLQELESMFAQSGEDADCRLHLGHALAKTREDLGEYAAALDWLKKAKALKRDRVAYSIETDRKLFEAAARTSKETAPGFSSREPIFVIGLPRTGTTLVERIFSSHGRVASAGESTNFALLLKRMSGTPSPLVLDVETLTSAERVDMAKLGNDYVAATRPDGHADKFVDKMPLNFFYAGLVHQALPEARIICIRRGAMDSCLSNYRQLFATSYPYYNYNLDLLDTARYYALFDALIGHWRKTIPQDRFTEVGYEEIIANQESETRRLLAFCDLEWDDRCLSFERNETPVATASSVQVRQPLYASSIGRWKRYGDALLPLQETLNTSAGTINLISD